MRRFHAFCSITFILIVAQLWGCSPRHSELVVLEVGPEKVTLAEYERFFLRSSGSWEAAQKSNLEERENFLELLTKYKLKLQDAYARNLLAEQDVQSELREYRTSLSTTYMLERELTEPALRELYARRSEEIRAQHILLRASESSTAEETLKVYNRALELIQRLEQGEDFGKLAEQYSEDPSASANKGDLYYFTAGQMVPPFEDAVYGLRVGEITKQPVRTAFGYHIVKLLDRRPSSGSIRVRHIMISTRGKEEDPAAMAEALKSIQAIKDSLHAGHDFAELAKQHSEDPGSANRGGDLGFFQRRRYIQEFEEVAFSLKPGQVSEIVRTPFGYHVIKCEENKPLATFEEMRPELQRIYQQQRQADAYARFIGRMKEKFDERIHIDVMNEMFAQLDTMKLPWDSLWAANVSDEARHKAIVTVGTRHLTVDSLITLVLRRQEFRDIPNARANLAGVVAKASDLIALELAASDLEDRSPDFKNLMKEFQDGVVLYKAEQTEVWNNVSVDEEKLRRYLSDHQTKFMFPDRIDITEILVDSESLAVIIQAELAQGLELDSVIARYKESASVEKTDRGLIPASTDEVTQYAWKHEEIFGPLPHRNSYVVGRVNSKQPARPKTFEEAGAELSTTFQDYESKRLEREWLERLKQRFPVVQHKKLLSKAFTGEKPSD